MRSNKIVALIVGLLVFFAADAPAASADTAASAPHRGAFYLVRHQGNTAYLFGTVHVGIPAFFPLEPAVMQAFSQASELAVEIDTRNTAPIQGLLTKYGLYGAGDSIDLHLSADNLARLKQALARFDIPFDQVAQMKPWMVIDLLLVTEIERSGYHASEGADTVLLEAATREAKPVVELESMDQQFALLASMPPRKQEQYLRENLAKLADGNGLKETTEMMDAWAGADHKKFETALRKELAEKTVSGEFTRQILLGQRNPQMAAKIEALLASGKSSFVAVGLLHLVGEQGIPALLRRHGYHVEKIY